MNNNRFLIAIGLLFSLALAACRGEASSTGHATLTVSQSIEGTQLVQQPHSTTVVNLTTAAMEPTVTSLSATVQVDSSSVLVDPAYFDGIVVLTQYYTLLDHGFFEEVLSLYSSFLLKASGGGNIEANLKSVKIRFIHPYNYWLVQQGQPLQPIPKDELWYIVGTTEVYKGEAWNKGKTTTPYSKTYFVSLVLENGVWKLNKFNSSPWVSSP